MSPPPSPDVPPDVPQVRRASYAELDPVTAYRILVLRERVFIVEQDCVYADLDGRDLEPGTVHLWIEAEPTRPAAYLRILDDGDHAAIGRVVTDPAHRGRGLAAVLVTAALEVVGDRRTEIHAQAHLRAWYARFGFLVTGDEFLEDGIPHLPMARG
ncbi:GNAT family N-acetyltransferase [Nocardioides sp. HDW12B]|uniref:GNAT family N-acetyltransferase n=1 Tax=Nocardioides sp. HDW12B TaxID=2714939 RepID=UPI00140C8F5E|nr:GNAT family N-acetyltransferase [Nocardioides sp. HDW12B]QIK65652.1 GNAT family N-acetyltransferase [Nocardioides sp. HDW12B]